MIYQLFFCAVSCFFMSVLLIPFLIWISDKYNLYDSVCERKIHNGNISRFGGVAIFLSFFPVAIYILMEFKTDFNVFLLILGMFIAFMSGFIDDLKRIRARYKLFSQVIAASFVFASGLMVSDLRIYTVLHIEFGFFSYFITVLWIVAFMNAVNLIDGLDGLSTGIVLIANLFVIIMSVIIQNNLVLFLSLSLEFSILGFYLFNFPPAKIFLGDGGAYFIGFMYAVLPLMGVKKSSALAVFLIPMILMLVPVSDVIAVMYNRFKKGQSIFTPDRNHLHHRLLNIGFSTKGILGVIYFYTAILGVFAIIMMYSKPEYTVFLFIFIILIFCLSIYILRKAEGVIACMQDKNHMIKDENEEKTVIPKLFIKKVN